MINIVEMIQNEIELCKSMTPAEYQKHVETTMGEYDSIWDDIVAMGEKMYGPITSEQTTLES